MFIDLRHKNIEQIDNYKNDLKNSGLVQFGSFFNIEQLWQGIELCQKRNVLNRFADFNGKIIIFDQFITEDKLYKFICGKTKEQRLEEQKIWQEQYDKKEREWKLKIPSLIDDYINKGREIIDSKYMNDWEEIVPIRLRDIYHGFELDSVLEIIKMANNNCPFEKIKEKLYQQGHSGLSYSLTLALFRDFSDVGKQYIKWLNETKSN